MDWQNFIKGLSVSTLIFGGVLFAMTILFSPEKGGVIIALYYFSFFMFITGLSVITNFFIRRWWMHNEVVFSNIKTSMRQGVLFALLLTALLLLSSMKLLTWWDGLIVVFSLALVELYFKTKG